MRFPFNETIKTREDALRTSLQAAALKDGEGVL